MPRHDMVENNCCIGAGHGEMIGGVDELSIEILTSLPPPKQIESINWKNNYCVQ